MADIGRAKPESRQVEVPPRPIALTFCLGLQAVAWLCAMLPPLRDLLYLFFLPGGYAFIRFEKMLLLRIEHGSFFPIPAVLASIVPFARFAHVLALPVVAVCFWNRKVPGPRSKLLLAVMALSAMEPFLIATYVFNLAATYLVPSCRAYFRRSDRLPSRAVVAPRERRRPPPPPMPPWTVAKAEINDSAVSPMTLPTAPPPSASASASALIEPIEEAGYRPGRILASRYVLTREIGRGMSAVVFAATDTTTRSTVAVKVLKPHLAKDRISLERFRREIAISREVRHPQIVTLFDLVDDGGDVFIVMDLVVGTVLKALIQREAPMAVERAVDVGRQLLCILAACHRCDVVHRDIKPQNVIVDAAGKIFLLDFGAARMASLTDLTLTGTSIGTPEYMAPELFQANCYDPRTDLYAVGIVLYETLTGRPPYQGDSLANLYVKHVASPPTSLAGTRSDAPPWLVYLIERLMAKQLFQRYQTADEALEDLASRATLPLQTPRLPTIDCLACGKETLERLPVCVQCGFERHRLNAPGIYSLYSTATTDRDKLTQLMHRLLKVRTTVRSAPRQLVLKAVHTETAALIRAYAIKHGVYLEVRNAPADKTPFVLVGLLTSGSICLWSGLKVVMAATGTLPGAAVAGGIASSLAYNAVLAAGMFPAVLFCLRHLRAESALGKVANLRHAVIGSQGVSPELTAALKGTRSRYVREFMARLFERHLLILEGADSGNGGTPVSLFSTCVRAASLLGQVADRLADFNVAAAAEVYQAILARTTGSVDADERLRLARHQRRLEEDIAAFYRLEDAYSRLHNKLIYVHSVYCALLGATVSRDLGRVEVAGARLADAGVELSEALTTARLAVLTPSGEPPTESAA